MKKILITLLTILLFNSTNYAQNVKDLINSGNSVFIEVIDTKGNTDGAYESFKKHLLSDEWNRWNLGEEVIALLMAEYGIDEERAIKDAEAFVKMLKDTNMLI